MISRPLSCCILAALLGIAATPALSGQGQPVTVIGEARDLESGEPLYSETYQCDRGGTVCSVLYRDLSGKKIALKKLDYRRNPLAPAVEIDDYRQSRLISVPLADSEDLVVDAGFDNFIRLNWEPLLQGQSLRFSFLVPDRSKPLPMLATRMPEAACGPLELCVEVALDSVWLAWLTDPIELTYSLDQRRLLRYRGVGNIDSAEGDSQRVDITYSYPGAPADNSPAENPALGGHGDEPTGLAAPE